MTINNAKVRHWLDQIALELTSEFDIPKETDEVDVCMAYNKYCQGMNYLRCGRYDLAENLFWESIDIYSTHRIDWDEDNDSYGYLSGMIYAPYLGISYCCTDTNRPYDAISVLKEAITVTQTIFEKYYLWPNYVEYSYWGAVIDLYVELCKSYVSVGDTETAYYYYERALDWLHQELPEERWSNNLHYYQYGKNLLL